MLVSIQIALEIQLSHRSIPMFSRFSLFIRDTSQALVLVPWQVAKCCGFPLFQLSLLACGLLGMKLFEGSKHHKLNVRTFRSFMRGVRFAGWQKEDVSN